MIFSSVSWQAVRHASKYAESITREEAHAASTMVTWKKIVSRSKGPLVALDMSVALAQSLFVAIPVVGYLTWKNLIRECRIFL